MCTDWQTSVPIDYLCDGVIHCPNGDDEGTRAGCAGKSFMYSSPAVSYILPFVKVYPYFEPVFIKSHIHYPCVIQRYPF